MATLNDIAKAAGCSVNLVSYVLKKTQPPTLERHKRILAIAKELNYVTNRSASALITGRTNNITLLTGDLYGNLKQLFFVEFLDALTTRLSKKGIGLVLQHFEKGDTEQLKKILLGGSSDGVVWYATPIAEEIEQLLVERKIPSISLLYRTNKISCLTIDDYQSVYNAAQYLYDCNHRQILYCGMENSPRHLAYRDFVADHHLDFIRTVNFSEFDLKNTTLMQEYFSKNGLDFTAILCERDALAISAVYVLKSLGIRVPDDVSVIGYDDLPESQECKPALTTIHHNYLEMVDETVDYLLNSIYQNNNKIVRKKYVHKLVKRDSVATIAL